MTDGSSALAGTGGHASQDLLAGYAAGAVAEPAAWSVEAHLMACAACRMALGAQADAGRLARNRSALLVRAAIGDDGPAHRLLRGCGVPDHLVRLIAATPSLRRSWLPAAFLLPSLAVCALALAAVSALGPVPAAVVAGALWVLPVLLLAGAQLPLTAVDWHGQAACAAVLLAAAAVLFLRRDRFESGWGQ